MKWLDNEPDEIASTAVKVFYVNPSSIQIRQLDQCYKEENNPCLFNQHSGNNLILIKPQDQAVVQFCQD